MCLPFGEAPLLVMHGSQKSSFSIKINCALIRVVLDGLVFVEIGLSTRNALGVCWKIQNVWNSFNFNQISGGLDEFGDVLKI